MIRNQIQLCALHEKRNERRRKLHKDFMTGKKETEGFGKGRE